MTYEPMTMPSVDCPTYVPNMTNQKSMVLDRLKQRFGNYEVHGRRCAERYKTAQTTINANEKRNTAMLFQRVLDKNKKAGKGKMDSRQKVSSVDPGDGDPAYHGLGGMQRMGQSLKRKMPMHDTRDGGFATDPHNRSQREAKKLKNDQQQLPPGMQPNGQRQQEYPLPSVSVQIVQNFGPEVPSNQIETTVNVHSNRSMPDSQSVSVNVGSKNIKQETMNDGRRSQQQMGAQQQQNMCPPSVGNPDSNDIDALLGDGFINGAEDLDMSMLDDIFEQMPEMINELQRELMKPETQQVTSQSQQVTSQSQQATSQQQQQQMSSQPQRMMSHQQQQHRITPQSQDMMSQSHRLTPQHMTQQQQHRVTPHMTSQTQQLMTSQSQQHMTSHHQQQQQHMTSPYSHSPQHAQMTSPLHHHHLSSPPHHMMQQNSRMVQCKREKVEMYHGFRGNTPENKTEPPVLPRQNSHPMNQPNISANIMTQQSVRVGGNNMSASISAQQNITLNMMQQNNYPPRQMPTNGGNMTSQHIHRLNQVAQFVPHDSVPGEPQRMYHPQTNPHATSQSSYYESHSQQLKHLAEKTRGGPGSMGMNPDPRSAQTLPPHYRSNGPPLSQQMNMPNHHHHHHAPPTNDRIPPHVDASLYSRSSQFVQSQRPGINMMMQQSVQQEAIMMKQYQMQPNPQHGYYNRVPEPHPQQVIPSNPNAFHGNGPPHPNWNSRGGGWPPSASHNHIHHRPNLDQMQRPSMNSTPNFPNLPEYDQDLNILDEILSKANQ